MLREFVKNGENLQATEAAVVLTREESDEVRQGMIQMTLQDMIDAKFSMCFSLKMQLFWNNLL